VNETTDNPRKILVVDDEEQIRQLLEMAICSEGFIVETADCGNNALKWLKENKTDLILTDVRMGHGTGIELLEAIRLDNPTYPPVMIMSAFTDFSIAEAYERGACAVVQKPFDLSSLLENINFYCRPLESPWQQSAAKGKNSITMEFDSLDKAKTEGDFQLGHCGFFLQTPNNYRKEETTSFEINFENGPIKSFCGSGIIRWRRKEDNKFFYNGVGIEITSLDEPSQQYMNSLVESGEIPQQLIPVGEHHR
jgi:two-component system, response regulator, stage 0 sporulation protein F